MTPVSVWQAGGTVFGSVMYVYILKAKYFKKIQPFDTLCINCVHVPLPLVLDINIHKMYTVYMITIHITEKQYTKHHKLIIKLQKALADMDTTTPQAAYNRRKRAASSKQTAAAGSTSDKRYNRFVEFTNINDQVCTQVVSGTEESLDRQFAKNKNLKPRWLSPLLQQGMATMEWQIANEPSTRWVTDTSNSWKAL